MGTTKTTKAADKSQVCRKFVTAAHKLYGKSVPKIELSVIETMLLLPVSRIIRGLPLKLD